MFETKLNFMNPEYFLHGHLKAQHGKGSELSDILLRAAELVKTAVGCRMYCVSIDASNSDIIWISEIWETAANHADSLKVDGVMALISQAIPILDGKPSKGQELKILGGYVPTKS